MKNIHKLLKMQIEEQFGSLDTVPKKYLKFLYSINASYLELESKGNKTENLSENIKDEISRASLFAKVNPEPVLRLDPAGKILIANEAAEKLFGRDELTGLSWYDICSEPPDGTFKKLIDKNKSDQIEVSINSRHYQFNIKSIAEYGFIHLYGSEITKRKNSELALKDYISEAERKNRFVSIINSVSTDIHQSISLDKVLKKTVESLSENLRYLDLISIYLIEGNCLELKAYSGLPGWLIEKAQSIPYPNGYMWKTIAAGVTRYTPDATKEEVIGKTSKDLGINSFLCIPLRDKEEIIGALSVSSKNKYAFESGEQELFKIVVSQIEDAISNARFAEERQKLIDQLEENLQKIKSMQQELITQEKLASLGTMTAGIAHEIKNPLNFVNNFSAVSLELTEELRETLDKEKDNLPADAYEDIDDIISNLETNSKKINEHGKRADRIVHTMLQHSRDKKGERQNVDINTLLDDDINLAYHGMRAQDETFNVSIEKEFDPNMEDVSIVPQDMSRVFLNILTNAFYETSKKQKRSSAGFSPEVIISTKNLSDSIEVRIRDNADGITEEAQKKLFTPFFTTKPAGQGTGLGLSISYDIIVTEHGGTLRFETQEDEFTEFIMTIPKS